jgi:SLT domain-containing protein
MGFSNGGVASFPSICGEQGPEAIIPLDYSRAQRAENIANTVNQTFNMGNNQTTALSLAQAVRSRDFTRAMTDNQFFTRRCGAF